MSIDLLTRDTLQDRGGGVWDYVSPSRLNLWLKCPLAWKFKYIDGIWTPASPAMFIGRRVHAGLECHYRHRQLGLLLSPKEILSRVDDSWEEAADAEAVAFSSGDEERKSRRQTAELLWAYLKQVSADEPRPLAVETAAEAPLVDPASGEKLGIPLVGVIDLVLDRDDGQDGPLIVDFKTSSRSAPPMEITHEVQLGCYAWLYRRVTGQREGGLEIRSLIRTKTPKVEYHDYAARSNVHFRRLFSVIRAYLDDLDSDRFVFRPGWGCASCEHRNGPCRDWEG